MRDLFLLHPHQHLLFSVFFKLFLIGVKWCLIMVLNSISVLSNSVEHLYMGLLVICIFSLEKCLFKTFAHLKNWVIYLFIIELYKLFTYLELNPYQVYDLQIFSPIQWAFILDNILWGKIAFNSDEAQLISFFFFWSCVLLGSYVRSCCPVPGHKDVHF